MSTASAKRHRAQGEVEKTATRHAVNQDGHWCTWFTWPLTHALRTQERDTWSFEMRHFLPLFLSFSLSLSPFTPVSLVSLLAHPVSSEFPLTNHRVKEWRTKKLLLWGEHILQQQKQQQQQLPQWSQREGEKNTVSTLAADALVVIFVHLRLTEISHALAHSFSFLPGRSSRSSVGSERDKKTTWIQCRDAFCLLYLFMHRATR